MLEGQITTEHNKIISKIGQKPFSPGDLEFAKNINTIINKGRECIVSNIARSNNRRTG